MAQELIYARWQLFRPKASTSRAGLFALTAHSEFVQFDPVPGSIPAITSKLMKRDVTFLCPKSQSATAETCLAQAKAQLGKSCQIKAAKAAQVCVYRQLNEKRRPQVKMVEEWWCSVDSVDCSTGKLKCDSHSKKLETKTSRQVTFVTSICKSNKATSSSERKGIFSFGGTQ